MAHFFTLIPRDPIVARDGRPFGIGQGNKMRSLGWISSSVLAGSLRSLLGKEAGGAFDPAIVEALKQISVAGPLPLIKNRIYLPHPLDCIVREHHDRREVLPLRPRDQSNGEGCDLLPGLCPAMIDYAGDDFKPINIPAFWSTDRMAQWLLDSHGRDFTIPNDSIGTDWGDGFLDAPEQDDRIHVQMNCDMGAGQEDGIFVSTGLDLTLPLTASAEPWKLAVRVCAGEEWNMQVKGFDSLHPLGGERRLVRWLNCQEKDNANLWDCPAEIKTALNASGKVRMVLATPAIFSHGWKPGWLNEGEDELEGNPPGCALRLRLVSAIVERWKPVSGWSLEAGRFGPKPVRRAAPAGCVYFFEIVQGSAEELAGLWLQSVCDDEQDRRDGFGLALWGVWDKRR
jgi:CRISPR-associated protein Cmr3